MELQLKKISKLVIVLFLLACSNEHIVEGNWSVIDSQRNYSELYFHNNKMRIYSEIAGYIGTKNIEIVKDSLFTPSLNYRIKEINRDSLIFISGISTLYLKRISTGFKLSDYTNENFEDTYTNSFYDRMYKRKGISPAENINSVDSLIPGIKEEIIEIKR